MQHIYLKNIENSKTVKESKQDVVQPAKKLF